MPYFHISTGLRGGYMPDQSYIVRVETRRALRDAIEAEASMARDAHYIGLSKRAVAHIAAEAWRRRNDPRAYLPLCLGYGRRDQSAPYGIFIGNASRSEYLQFQAEV